MTTEINIEEVYKAIKKQNGEQFAKILRENVLLNIPNLQHILEFAGKNPADATALVPILREIQQKSNSPTIKQEVTKAPLELLFDAGYDAFYVNTLAKQNSIRKYFRPNEELCTFRDNSRYINNYMIHAVKRGADKIKPSTTPEREDEYGTSVISIQIAKTGGFISIKNRYNHTVNDPDNTFNSNPDNIISGLSESLKQHFNVDFMTHGAAMPDHYRAINDQLVRYNYEIDNTYFDEKYYFCGSEITKLNTDHEVMLDNVILDTKTNKVRSVLSGKNEEVDGLVRVLNDELSGYTTKIEKDKTTQETVIKIIDANKQEQELARTKNGCITSLNLYKTEKIWNDFLYHNKTLTTLNAPKLQDMGWHCFFNCHSLTSLNLPKLQEMGVNCFYRCHSLTTINAPKLQKMGGSCFRECHSLTIINAPELQSMGTECFKNCDSLATLNAPKLQEMGCGCFKECHSLTTLNAPELQSMGRECFRECDSLTTLNAPKLQKMGQACFNECPLLTTINLSELQSMDCECFSLCNSLTTLNLPKLQSMPVNCFYECRSLTTLNAPKLQKMEGCCFERCPLLTSMNLSELQSMKYDCFNECNSLTILDLPKLQKINNTCFRDCASLTAINLPELQSMGNECFRNCDSLATLNAPKLQDMGATCFTNVKRLNKLYAPKLKIDKNTPDCIRYFNKNIFQIARAKLEERLSLSNKTKQNNIYTSETIDR